MLLPGWIGPHDGVDGTCAEIGLSIAGDALSAVTAGDTAKYIWAVGVLVNIVSNILRGVQSFSPGLRAGVHYDRNLCRPVRGGRFS